MHLCVAAKVSPVSALDTSTAWECILQHESVIGYTMRAWEDSIRYICFVGIIHTVSFCRRIRENRDSSPRGMWKSSSRHAFECNSLAKITSGFRLGFHFNMNGKRVHEPPELYRLLLTVRMWATCLSTPYSTFTCRVKLSNRCISMGSKGRCESKRLHVLHQISTRKHRERTETSRRSSHRGMWRTCVLYQCICFRSYNHLLLLCATWIGRRAFLLQNLWSQEIIMCYKRPFN